MAEIVSKKRIALLSNVTVDLITGKLRRKYDFYLPAGFDTWVREVIDPTSGLHHEKIDAAVVLLDGTEARSWKTAEDGSERIRLWKQAVTAVADRFTDIPVFVSTIDIRENRIRAYAERKRAGEMENDWYRFVQDLAEGRKNLFVWDLADTIRDIGRKQFYSDKMWYMSSMPYSRDGLQAVSTEIDRALCAAFEPRRKIIALDLDNTLWGGVIGEDGLEGIELSDHKEGQRFYDFQRQLLEMKNRGVVLAVISKNNEEDAEAAIREHPYMLLRDADFVSRKINWDSKAANLKRMEKELNLTEGGFIFVDDNPIERETVKGECGDALVPAFPLDTSELLGFAEDIWFDHCRPLRVLGEDLQKTQMYQNEMKRKQELSESLNLDDYIARLDMSADIHRMRREELDRVTQLINKTNQFNVTTKRYVRAEVEQFASDPKDAVYVVYSADKFGDNGLISVLILKERDADVYIDTFLMSCRVMGRKLENVIVNEIAAAYAGHRKLIAEFIPTAKNAPVQELYDRLGFHKISEDDGRKLYELDLTGYEKKSFENYKEIRFEG